MSSAIKICVLCEGYSFQSNIGEHKADGTITLIKTENHNIVIDTGLPCSKEKLINALKSENLTTDDIDIVIGTHGHSDHIGNLNIFENNPLLIVGEDISRKDIYFINELINKGVYNICNGIYVMSTNGHTSSDVSVIVERTPVGSVAIVGDLFECEEDILNEKIWTENSSNVELQRINRLKVANLVSQIIPGHGPAFQMTDVYRNVLSKSLTINNAC